MLLCCYVLQRLAMTPASHLHWQDHLLLPVNSKCNVDLCHDGSLSECDARTSKTRQVLVRDLAWAQVSIR